MKKISLSTLKKGLSRDEMRSVKGAGCGCRNTPTSVCSSGCEELVSGGAVCRYCCY